MDNTWPVEADKHAWGNRETLLSSSGFEGRTGFRVHNAGSHIWHSQLPPKRTSWGLLTSPTHVAASVKRFLSHPWLCNGVSPLEGKGNQAFSVPVGQFLLF